MERVKTSRELRCEPQLWEIDESKKKDVLKFKDGNLGKNITVSENKMILSFKKDGSGGCYPDDVLARLRDMLMSYGDPDDHTGAAIRLIQSAIEALDMRAENKHGYSGSKEEMLYIPPYKDISKQ